MMIRNLLPCALLVCVTMPILAADAPSSAPATTQSSARSVEDVLNDFNAATGDLRGVLTPAIFKSSAKRTEAAPKAIPALTRVLALSDELIATGDNRGMTIGKSLRGQMLPMLAAFGEESATATLTSESKSDNATEALAGKCGLLLAHWWDSSDNADAQAKLADQGAELAKANSDSTEVAQTLMMMSQLGAASSDLSDRLESTVADSMQGRIAEMVKQEVSGQKKLRSVEGKPLAIAGKLVDGSDFSTDQWKGKVVLVDFWATWCGPCLGELPRVKKAYADFHDKGLEVLGVSNDYDASALQKFVAADPAMPWPQLFDADAAAKHSWNPITQGFGINGIPTMFLIDKKGVCRTVKAREDFEELIPKMLAE